MIGLIFNKKTGISQTGDTIVEVLISVCVLSLALASCYAIANRSLQTGTESAQRSEALALAQKQIEYVKYASINNSTWLATYINHTGVTNNFCILPGGVIKPNTDSLCRQGSLKQYKISTSYNSPVFTVTATWETARGGVLDSRCPSSSQPCDMMTLFYKLPV